MRRRLSEQKASSCGWMFTSPEVLLVKFVKIFISLVMMNCLCCIYLSRDDRQHSTLALFLKDTTENTHVSVVIGSLAPN